MAAIFFTNTTTIMIFYLSHLKHQKLYCCQTFHLFVDDFSVSFICLTLGTELYVNDISSHLFSVKLFSDQTYRVIPPGVNACRLLQHLIKEFCVNCMFIIYSYSFNTIFSIIKWEQLVICISYS